MSQLETHTSVLEDQIILAHIDQLVIVVGADDKIKWTNTSFERITGFTLEEVVGKKVSEFLGGPETDKSTVGKMDKAIFIDKKPFSTELIQYRKDRSTFWAKLHLTPVLDKEGNLQKYITVGTDITDERNYRKKVDDLALVTSNISQMVIVLDAQDRIQWVNRSFCSELGYSLEEIYNKKASEVIGGEETDIETVARMDNAIFIEKKPITCEAIQYRKDGTYFWARLHLTPILNDQNELEKYIVVGTDISSEKEAQKRKELDLRNAKLLGELGAEITAEHEIYKICELVYEKLNNMIDADSFGIGMISGGKLHFPLIVEEDKLYKDHVIDLEKEEKLGAISVNKGEDIVILNAKEELPKYGINFDPFAGKATWSIVYLPFYHEDKVKGVITVQSFRPDAYNEYDITLIKNLNTYVSTALEKAKLYEEMEEQITQRTEMVVKQKQKLEESYSQARFLSDVGFTITSSLSFDEIFESLHRQVSKLMPAEMFGVRILNADRSEIIYKYQIERGQRSPEISVSMEDDDNYTVWCVKNEMEILIKHNSEEYKEYVNEIKVPAGKMPESLIFVPLEINNKIIGVITVQSHDIAAYSLKQLHLLRSLASYTASALDKAELYETLEHKVIERTKKLNEINENLLDSINYAKRIHTNLLPSDPQLHAIFKNSFVYYKPKDLLSGDFFLVDYIHDNNGDVLKCVIVGDCTGHGVPGGILSVLCSSLLKQTLTAKDVNSPADALNFTRTEICKLLIDKNNIPIRDGMDVAFCVINVEKKEMYFAGANNSCHILRNGEFIRIKGDRQHVGYSEKIEPFTTQTVSLESDDQLYITTDGYIDQFGGEKYKKMKIKSMYEKALEVTNLPMPDKKIVFQNYFEEWKADNEQTDDVCLLGFKPLD